MECRIDLLQEKKLVGKHLIMSFANNKTKELWQSFMPAKKLITGIKSPDLFSLEVYPAGFFDHFNPANEFQKWAAAEVIGFDCVPEGMESITIPAGLYAVFLHKGLASDGPKTYHYIFNEWLPNSGYKLDNRPHFALMGEKYRNDDPGSEEEIWIPVIAEKMK
jgi:AraC family transcriptional regulator